MFPEFGSFPRIHETSVLNDFPDHTSGLQKWNGADDILNKRPTDIITKDNCI